MDIVFQANSFWFLRLENHALVCYKEAMCSKDFEIFITSSMGHKNFMRSPTGQWLGVFKDNDLVLSKDTDIVLSKTITWCF